MMYVCQVNNVKTVILIKLELIWMFCWCLIGSPWLEDVIFNLYALFSSIGSPWLEDVIFNLYALFSSIGSPWLEDVVCRTVWYDLISAQRWTQLQEQFIGQFYEQCRSRSPCSGHACDQLHQETTCLLPANCWLVSVFVPNKVQLHSNVFHRYYLLFLCIC